MRFYNWHISLYIFLALHPFAALAQKNFNTAHYIDSIKKHLLTQKNDTNKVKALNALSNLLNQNADVKNGMQSSNEALALSKKLKLSKAGNGAYQNITDSSDGIKNDHEALIEHQQVKDKHNMLPSIPFIDMDDDEPGDDAQTLKNLEASLKKREKVGDKKGLAQIYNSIARIYSNQGKYDQALEKHGAALDILQQLGIADLANPDTYTSIAATYINQGDIFSEKGDKAGAVNQYTEALKNALLGLKKWQDEGKKDAIAQSYITLGNINTKLNNFLEARTNLEKGLEISKGLDDKKSLSSTYGNLSFLDDKEGNYKQAYEYYKLYILYRDSVNNVEISKKFLSTKMKHEYEMKEAMAKIAQDKKDAAIRHTRNIQYLVIISLGILIFAAVAIAFVQFRNNKQKQKANDLLKLQKEKVEGTLSELKTTQFQLIQSEKMASLGELTAGIAHEIQNPLNFVNNFAEVNAELIEELRHEQKKKPRDFEYENEILNDIRENEQKINHHGKRAGAIVKGMLQHSRSGSGKKELTDINALADEYFRLSFHGLRAKDKSFHATIQTDFDKSMAKINIIPQDLGRVFLNLFANAFYSVNEKKKRRPENYEPVVSVSTKRAGATVEITVKDNGTGIPQKVLDKIYQPFFTTKPTGQGTGLGLSLSYDIIKSHGGEIKVDTKEGQGASFVIVLPVEDFK